MSLQTVPVQPTPNQSFQVVLDERNVSITLRTLQDVVYADVLCEGVPICAGRICRDRQVFTARAEHLGFPGLALCFADLRGSSDPQWQDFGTRFLLLSVRLTTAEQSQLLNQAVPSVSGLVYDGSSFYDGGQTFDGMA